MKTALGVGKKRVGKIIAAITVLTLALAGCAPAVVGPTPMIDSTIPGQYQEFYEQQVDWSPCGLDEQTFCGDIVVPVDWANPADGTLKLAVAFHEADSGKPLGSLIFNPGGPGSSAVPWITDSIDQLGTAQLRKNFNMVGFDPRGVGSSEPTVECLSPKDTDRFLYGTADYELGSAADLKDTRDQLAKFVAACLNNTGPNLAFIDTVSAAKDLDVIRAVFGDAQINYLGFSYGTQLGATYAALFPQRVGRMVLDGAINPTLSDAEQSLQQLVGFDQALKNFLANCLQSADCPFSGNLDNALLRIQKFLAGLESSPLPTETDRELTVWAAITGLIMPLYSESYWPYLSQGFAEGFAGDGTTLLALADSYNERAEDGSYGSNLMEANISISCLDARSPSDAASMAAQNQKILEASPVLGRYWQYGALTCEQWPFAVVEHPANYAASGSKPIMVVGTTGDPATPYAQAVSLANDVLENGVLVTFNGEGHTAYGQESKCVNDTVDNYFIRNVVPVEDPNC